MEEANSAVPESTPSSSSSATVPEEFGANEWLVEEMYDRFQADPASVDQTWVDYFKAHGNGSPGDSGEGSASGGTANGATASSTGAATTNGTPTAMTTESRPEPKAPEPAPAAPAAPAAA